MNDRFRLQLVAWLGATLLSACATLDPVELPPEYTPPPAETTAWETLDEFRHGDWYALLNDGPNALDWRLRAIDSATESIDLQTFLWTFDTVGAVVLDHLLAAAERGVLVKMLVDDTFLLGEDAILLEIAYHPNIEYRVFNPYKRRASGFATRQALNLAEFHRLDHRMHNKAMIVDNRIAIVGGRNLADEYFGLHDSANFRDLEVIVGGPVVLEVTREFDAYWNDRWSVPIESLSHVQSTTADLAAARQVREDIAHLHAEETAEARLEKWKALVADAFPASSVLYVDDPPEDSPALAEEAPVQVANALTELFDNASEEIVIVSAYLIPTPALAGAVDRAVERGVRVRMLTNSIRSNNHLTAHSAYRNHIKEMLDSGAELHEVRIDAHDRHMYMLSPVDEKQLMLHSKALIIDRNKVFIGSANLDPRSLRINTEMGFLIESEALNETLRAAVAPDFERSNAWELQLDDDGDVVWVSDEVTLTSQPAVSTWQRIEDWFFAHLPIEDEL
jgi:putative cardiolipin synthase